MKPPLENIRLDMISTGSYGLFDDLPKVSRDDLKERIDAIEKKGAVEPVLLLPPTADNSKYYLVGNLEAYVAARCAGMTHIPAFVLRVSTAKGQLKGAFNN